MASKISLGLENISLLLQRLNNPQRAYEVVHVAGTNGKGSVSAMIANTLARAGLKTGLYTSPHLAHRWDSIRINNECIKYANFSRIERQVHAGSQALKAVDCEISSFEQMTATAFKAFQDQNIDIAVVEVGLGGERDATNVVDPVLSVITAIGIDHTDFLGKTINSIARAKAGIIKPGVPVVASSDQEHGEVFSVLGAIHRQVNPGRRILWTPPNSTCDFRISNRNTARSALQCLRDQCSSSFHKALSEMSDEVIEEGLATTTWHGRCERLDLSLLNGPDNVLIDGAHNKQSVAALGAVIAQHVHPRTFIFAMTSGKDPSSLATLLRPGDTFITTQFEKVDDMAWVCPMSSKELLDTILQNMSDVRGLDYGDDVAGAIRRAREISRSREVLICGSLYLVGQVFRLLQAAEYEHLHYPASVVGQAALPPYDSTIVEGKVQQYWRELPPVNPATKQYLESKMKFLLPPPNVTGSLHIGHALTLAIEDAYCRYYTLLGHDVTWVPGTDHAGIATQSVVSKQLAKENISTGRDVSREQFIDHIWKWKEKYGGVIHAQTRRLGTSLDWASEYFTLDESRKEAVLEAFKRLWNAGMITRENRMVNWSVGLQSVISDIEVQQRTVDVPTTIDGVEFGKMWRIKYEVVQESQPAQYVEVDTTRPETIFGDRTLAVHPKDQRYHSLIGSHVKHPLLDGVRLEIVEDEFVKPDLGTGCVKVTPAHDADDYHMSRRHQCMPLIPVFGLDGKMLPIPEFPELQGLDRLQARNLVLKLLERRDALVSSQPHKMVLAICSRSGTVLEPSLMPQWYIAMKPLTAQVKAKDDIKMSDSTRKEWDRWLDNAQDWCISRQLVWGHRIPLYKVLDKQQKEEKWVFGTNEAEAIRNAGGCAVEQDNDVLDTWFSSSLLPLSAFGWPTTSIDSRLEFIESGPDILFFWLIRMAVMCTFLNHVSPFKEIVLHPLIRDSQGRKMSKSLGNVIDPMSLINGQTLASLRKTLVDGNLEPAELAVATDEINKAYPEGMQAYGADALRFALVQSTAQSEALKFDIRNLDNARYIGIKLWNAVNFYKFKRSGLGQNTQVGGLPDKESPDLISSWIVLQSVSAYDQYASAFSKRSLAEATTCLRYFLVDQVCDVYLEFLKISLRGLAEFEQNTALNLLRAILERLLQMFAPFMPHIAEELWHALDHTSSIHRERLLPNLPLPPSAAADIEYRTSAILELLKSIRALPNHRSLDIVLHVVPQSSSICDIRTYLTHLQQLAGLKSLTLTSDVPGDECIHVSPEIAYVVKQLSPSSFENTSTIKRLQKKLEHLREVVSKPEYTARVPAPIQAKHKKQLEDLERKLAI